MKLKLAALIAGLLPAVCAAQIKTVQLPAVGIAPIAGAAIAPALAPALTLPQTRVAQPILNSPHPNPLPFALRANGRGNGNGAFQQLLAAAAPAAEPSGESSLLAKARELGLPDRTVAEELRASSDFHDAAGRLARLGLMSPKAAELAASERPQQLRWSLHRLWHDVAPTLPPQFKSDTRWSVPALTVEKDGVTYYVHGLLHGHRNHPAYWRDARRLARELEARGLPLYWEQGLPEHYGTAYGREALDHRALRGKPAALRDAPAEARLGAVATTLRRLAWSAAFLALPGAAIAQDPSNPLGWLGLGAAALPIAELWTGFRRLMRLHLWSEARSSSSPDEAHTADERIKAAFGRRVDFPALWRVELPLPLKLSELPRVAERSESIALAVRDEAQARGNREVHIVVGYNHAPEVAWHLSR
ncbi:MAG: hypothetical protein HY553_08030 [Elusimicrobia bacterium]|nr:hypothetical protein [Elusimicrobiota bacterium]